MRFPTKFPTLIGIVLFLSLIAGFAFVFERVVRLPTRASGAYTPTSVEISNVTDATFTLSWTTNTAVTGALRVTDEKKKSWVVYDERDVSGKLGVYTTHHVTVRNGTPHTRYTVKILSSGKTILNNGRPYEVRTGPALSGSTNLEPAYGLVSTETGSPAAGSIVYLTLPASQKLSALVTESGSWIIPLNLLRTDDLTAFVSDNDRLTETILVRSSDKETLAITDTLNDNPVPDMTIGKTYDFRKVQAQIPKAPEVLGATTISLVKPQEGATLTTNLPLIQGTGIPGNVVSITIGITSPVGGTTTVASDGIWRYTPELPLSPGKQIVTITTNDQQNKPMAMSRTFEILKSGTQVLGTATPSATPILSPTPTSTLAGEPLPQSGSVLPTLILLIFGLALLSGGFVLLTNRLSFF